MIFGTKKLFIITLILLVVSLSVFIYPVTGYAVYSLLFFLCVAVVIDYIRIPPRNYFTVTRQVESKLSIGQPNKVMISVTTPRYLPAQLKVADFFPDTCNLINEEYSTIDSGSLMYTYFLKPVKRGIFQFQATQLHVTGNLGLCGKQFKYLNPLDIKVYPDIQTLKKFLMLKSKNRESDMGIKTLIHGGMYEYDFLREYQSGDNYKDINWNATARRNTPVIQVNRKEIQRNIITLIDCGRMMTTRYNDLTKLDHVINASLLLAATILKSSDRFGLAAFDDEVKVFLEPSNMKNVYEKILSELYSIEPGMVKSDYQKIFTKLRSKITKNAILFVFSELYNNIVSSDLISILILMAKHHTVILVNFEEAEQYAEGTSLADITRFTIQISMEAEKRKIKNRLHEHGIETLTVNHTNITRTIVNKYLSL